MGPRFPGSRRLPLSNITDYTAQTSHQAAGQVDHTSGSLGPALRLLLFFFKLEMRQSRAVGKELSHPFYKSLVITPKKLHFFLLILHKKDVVSNGIFLHFSLG